MAILQELVGRRVAEIVFVAAQRYTPVTVTVRDGDCWVNTHSRVIATRDNRMLIEMPPPDVKPDGKWTSGDRVGLSFKLKHHKHICACTVAAAETFGLEDGVSLPVLSLFMPTRMQRLQRRAYVRADVPPGRVVRAAFWIGGVKNEPQGTTAERPVWSGRVTNLSAGGFQVAMPAMACGYLDNGETVGVRICFGAATETVFADAVYRHTETREGLTLLGFQFVGLEQNNSGHGGLTLISEKVQEFQNISSVLA